MLYLTFKFYLKKQISCKCEYFLKEEFVFYYDFFIFIYSVRYNSKVNFILTVIKRSWTFRKT